MLDCKSGTLSLELHAMSIHYILQSVDMPLQVNSDDEVVSALVTSTQEIPGRTIQRITCKAKGNVGCFEDTMEGLFELMVATQNLPNHLCVARSLSTIRRWSCKL